VLGNFTVEVFHFQSTVSSISGMMKTRRLEHVMTMLSNRNLIILTVENHKNKTLELIKVCFGDRWTQQQDISCTCFTFAVIVETWNAAEQNNQAASYV